MGDKDSSILKEEWIEICLGYSPSATSIVEAKEILKRYAEEKIYSMKST